MCVCVGLYAHMDADAQGVQKRASGPQTVVSHPMWGLGTKPESSAASPALSSRALPPVPTPPTAYWKQPH